MINGAIDIDKLNVTCPVSGKKLDKFTRLHAEQVGYETLSQYRKENGLDYLTAAQRARQKIKYLYNIDYTKWVVGYQQGGGMRYVHKTYVDDYEGAVKAGMRSASKFPLSDSNFNRHLRGQNPIAIFAHGTHSRWFGFDVDSKEQAQADTFKLVNTLEAEGINIEDIHVSFSGSKGYHVEIFTDKHIRFTDWDIFARFIIHQAELAGKPIEWRPTKTNGHAWKLPLTLHPKTNNFAGYCDKNTLEVMSIQKSYDYLFEIKQITTSRVLAIIAKARECLGEIQAKEKVEAEQQRQEAKEKRKAVKVTEFELYKTGEEKEDTAVKIITEGLPGTGTRWKAMRNVLIPYLKIIGKMSAEDIRSYLIEWTKREIAEGRTSTPLKECIKEIDRLLENFYPKVDGFYSVVRDIEVTRSDLDWVLSVIEEGGTRNARDLLWALLLLSKAYGQKDGLFFASFKMLQKLLNKPKKISENTIQKQRDWLHGKGYIDFTVPKNYYRERKATQYKIKNAEVTDINVIDSIVFDEDSDARNLLVTITNKVYTPKTALKKYKIG